MQSSAEPVLDSDLLSRYGSAGPRYTSYPTAPQFKSDFDEAQFRAHAQQTQAVYGPRPLSLYVHIPFCRSPCFFCGCNRIITRDTAAGARYIAYLTREIALVAPLFDRRQETRQLHLGGGTPHFLPQEQMRRLVEELGRHFHFSAAPDRDFSIEIDPRFATAADIEHLSGLGFNRASLGVQDFDPAVQQAVNRIQSVEETLGIIDACRSSGFRSVNVDLIYGLPHQTAAGFRRTLETVIAARPDRLAIYGYAHMPRLFKAQRQIDAHALPGAEGRIALLQLAIERLGAAGYRYIGMDHFALPGDDLSRAQEAGGLHRNFMGYTTHAGCDLVGFGMSAISHVGDSFSQNFRDLRSWEAALDSGRLPVWRGLSLSHDDQVRADVIQRLMCLGVVDFEEVETRHEIAFEAYFADALARIQPLVADGLVLLGERRIQVTGRGRFLLRIVAMCFDRYLAQSDTGSATDGSSAAAGSPATGPAAAAAALTRYSQIV